MADLALTSRTLRDLGWDVVLSAAAALAQTSRGAEEIRDLPFLPDEPSIEAHLTEIEEARALLRRDLPLPVGGVEDVRALIERAQKGAVLENHEIVICGRVAQAAASVARFVAGLAEDVPALAHVAKGLVDLRPFSARINATFDSSGLIRDDASVELAEYRQKARRLHARAKSRVKELLDQPDFVHMLQDDYFTLRNDRYVFPVQAGFRGQVPGIVHNASQSGQTIFVELDEMIPLGNELAIAESLAAEEELRVLAELSEEIAERGSDLTKNANILGRLDRQQALARLCEKLECHRPQLARSDGPIRLRQARHPILLLQQKKVIPNDIVLDRDGGERALVVSGPNAGGKTVAMSTLGLCALFVRAGLPIPAGAGSTVPLFKGIGGAIGDAQDLSRDLSTFTSHIQSLGEILNRGRHGWLCLVDEIAAGTDPTEGGAIATGVLRALVDAGARLVVTTHLETIKALGLTDDRFVNARVGLDGETLRPTYRLQLGAAGVSNAIDVAAQAGLPEAVIREARQALEEGGALTVALSKLEKEHQRAEHARASLEAEVAAARKALAEAEAAREQARREAREIEATVRRELAEELEEARKIAAQVVAELQQAPTMRAAQAASEALRQAARDQVQQAEVQEVRSQVAEEGREVGVEDPITVGTRVRIASLGHEGDVIALDGDDATVQAGIIKTRAKLSELVPVSKRSARKERRRQAAEVRKAEETAEPDIDSAVPGATCDLRGMRADEARDRVTGFLDRSFLDGLPAVAVIHGHGTGVLKEVVREALRHSELVARTRPGERHEGGDGVTIATLKR